MDLQQTTIDALKERFGAAILGEGEHAGQRWVYIPREHVVEILTHCRDALGFEMLMDQTCVDYLNQGTPERFCVVWQLYSMKHNAYFRLKAWVPEEDAEVPTASGIWKAANWAEREIYDMFGVRFRGHPDMRRLLLPFDYDGHPLRKDYPLQGRGERYNFPRYTK